MKTKLKVTGLILTLTMLFATLVVSGITASAAGNLTVAIDTGASITLKDTDSDGYYEIGTVDELYAFAAAVNGGNTAINGELTANITVNTNVLEEIAKDEPNTANFRTWTLIGYYTSDSDNARYSGTFDGNGKTVSGLYFNNSSTPVWVCSAI